MEPFEIQVAGINYTIMAQPDGSFAVFTGENLLGTIIPDIQDPVNIKWTTLDLLSPELAQQVGEAIESHEM